MNIRNVAILILVVMAIVCCFSVPGCDAGNRISICRSSKKATSKVTPTILLEQNCDICSICLVNFKAGQQISITSCGHGFHPGCIGPWYQKVKNCPYCRKDLSREQLTTLQITL